MLTAEEDQIYETRFDIDLLARSLEAVTTWIQTEAAPHAVGFFGVVRSVSVVEPEYTAALLPTSEPTLTLITCFPFDYLGPAPRRYVVQAVVDGAGGVRD